MRNSFTKQLVGRSGNNLPSCLYYKGSNNGVEIYGSEDWDSREYLLTFNSRDVVIDAEMRQI